MIEISSNVSKRLIAITIMAINAKISILPNRILRACGRTALFANRWMHGVKLNVKRKIGSSINVCNEMLGGAGAS